MWYMPFGTQKWIYTQKPRTSFSTLKKMHEKELHKKDQNTSSQDFPQEVSLNYLQIF